MKFKSFMKAYIWVIALLFLSSLVLEIIDSETPDIFDYLDYLFWLIALTGVFGYCHNKEILTKQFWKIYLPFVISWDIFIIYRVIATEPELHDPMIFALLLIIFSVILIPEYVAICLYAKKNKAT